LSFLSFSLFFLFILSVEQGELSLVLGFLVCNQPASVNNDYDHLDVNDNWSGSLGISDMSLIASGHGEPYRQSGGGEEAGT